GGFQFECGLYAVLDPLVDGLDLGIELEPRATGLAEGRGAGALQAAEWRVHQVAGRGAVDLDRARLDLLRKAVHRARVARRDRRGQAVLRVVRLRDHIFVAGRFDDREHRPEDLLARDAHLLRDVGEDRGRDVVAMVVAGAGQPFAPAEERRFLAPDRDVAQ